MARWCMWRRRMSFPSSRSRSRSRGGHRSIRPMFPGSWPRPHGWCEKGARSHRSRLNSTRRSTSSPPRWGWGATTPSRRPGSTACRAISTRAWGCLSTCCGSPGSTRRGWRPRRPACSRLSSSATTTPRRSSRGSGSDSCGAPTTSNRASRRRRVSPI